MLSVFEEPCISALEWLNKMSSTVSLGRLSSCPTYVWSFNHSQTSLPFSELPSLKYLSHWVIKTSQFTFTHLTVTWKLLTLLASGKWMCNDFVWAVIDNILPWHLESKWCILERSQCYTGNGWKTEMWWQSSPSKKDRKLELNSANI